jgi:hypothetical protein
LNTDFFATPLNDDNSRKHGGRVHRIACTNLNELKLRLDEINPSLRWGVAYSVTTDNWRPLSDLLAERSTTSCR